MPRIMRCHHCSSEWDIDVMRAYPFPEDKRYIKEPMPPLMGIDVSPKVAFLCFECLHEYPNLREMEWITEKIWDRYDPDTRAESLPQMIHDEERDITWDPETYYTANGPGGWPIN